MHPRKFIDAVALCMGVLSGFSMSARGQQATDPLDTCYQLQDTAAKAACYDQEVRRRHAAAVAAQAPRPAPVTSTTTAAAAPTTVTANRAPAIRPAPDDTIGLDGRQLDIKRKAEGIQPVAIKPLVATLSRLQSRPGHQYYFELDNGQVWESTDTEPDLFLSPRETVSIRPGVLGAFFLKTQEGNSIRVHRLR